MHRRGVLWELLSVSFFGSNNPPTGAVLEGEGGWREVSRAGRRAVSVARWRLQNGWRGMGGE